MKLWDRPDENTSLAEKCPPAIQTPSPALLWVHFKNDCPTFKYKTTAVTWSNTDGGISRQGNNGEHIDRRQAECGRTNMGIYLEADRT